jgi:hypothetical protein
MVIGAPGDQEQASRAGAAYLFRLESFTLGWIAEGVRFGSVTAEHFAPGAVTAASMGG